MRLVRFLTLGLLAVGTVACGSATELASDSGPTAAPSTSTTSTPTSIEPQSSTEVETSSSSMSSVVSTTSIAASEVSSAYPAQSPDSPRTPPGFNRAGRQVVAVDDTDGVGRVISVDLDTGSIEPLATIPLEARWIGRLQLGWEGEVAYYSSQHEDYWFSCDSAPGEIIELDLSTGSERTLASGGEPRVSPDGRRLAYLAASQCLPDPYDPENFWSAPYDSVVVVDLATGVEQVWVDTELRDLLAEDLEADQLEAQLQGLVWLGADTIAVGDRRLDAEQMEVTALAADLRAEVGGFRELLGFDGTTGLVYAEDYAFVDDERRAGLISIDPDTGETAVVVPISRTGNATFAFDAPVEALAISEVGRLVFEGGAIRVDAQLDNFDW